MIRILAAAAVLLITPWTTAGVTFERLISLKPTEGVFAYARISPSGKYLAYASEMPTPDGKGITQTETIISLPDTRVIFTAPGIDGYFSNDNERLIFLSFTGSAEGNNVAIRNMRTGTVTHDVAPMMLGDYFSWAVRDGKHLILTIASVFYYLDGNRGVMPYGEVQNCPGIGKGERPLISKDGRRITTFVKGNVVVRNLTDCNDILDTGLQGAKADFSWNGRYVAFHVEKADHKGSEIVVVDTQDKTVRTLTGLTGTSVFPSWTEDGRLCFRYDGTDFRGFMMASNVLSLPARPLKAPTPSLPESLSWSELFPDTPQTHRTNLVMVWSDWSPHSPMALAALQQLDADVRARGLDVGVMTAVPEGSRRADIDRILNAHAIRLPEIGLRPDRLHLTGALNQIPTELLFRDGVLIAQHLGPQSYDDVSRWLASRIATDAKR